MLIKDERGLKVSRILESLPTETMTEEEVIAAIQKEIPDYRPLPVEEWEKKFDAEMARSSATP